MSRIVCGCGYVGEIAGDQATADYLGHECLKPKTIESACVHFSCECLSVSTKAMKAELADTKRRLEIAKEAMKEAHDKMWFDGTREECGACMWCDLGDSGEIQSKTGHDIDCPGSILHEALAQIEGEKK